MPSLSDRMLDSGCALHVEAAHSESIRILSGTDAGRTFYAVKENETDMVLTTDLGADPRAKRMLRFRNSNAVPAIGSQASVETADGKIWLAVRAPQDGYLTTDFELIEKVDGKDT